MPMRIAESAQPAERDPIGQRRAGHQFHGHPGTALGFAHIVDVADVRMVERGGLARFVSSHASSGPQARASRRRPSTATSRPAAGRGRGTPRHTPRADEVHNLVGTERAANHVSEDPAVPSIPQTLRTPGGSARRVSLERVYTAARRWRRNSWLPAAPVMGDGVMATRVRPHEAALSVTRASTVACTTGSFTSPPRPTSPRPLRTAVSRARSGRRPARARVAVPAGSGAAR